MGKFQNPIELFGGLSERIRPPRRMAPIDAAAQFLRIESGRDADVSIAPMMAEPLNQLAGRDYQGIVFVGPQRSSKTFLLIWGGLSWIVKCSPADLLIVAPTESNAIRMSKQEFARVLQHSKALKEQLSPRASDDNLMDKWWRSGMVSYLGYSAASQLTQRTSKYVFITDYDRPENRDDVDGLGPLWDLALKRVETAMSLGKCLAESAPGEEVSDANWKPPEDEPHRAPPTRGILSIYNNGTRGRWYFRCPHSGCRKLFQCSPGYELFRLPPFEKQVELVRDRALEDLVEEYAVIPCPHCGTVLEQSDKKQMNADGTWVHEGQEIVKDARVTGSPRRTNIWSGWLGGAGAAYQPWTGLLRSYFQAVEVFNNTGEETSLRSVTQSDAAMPYISRSRRSSRSVEELRRRLEETPVRTLEHGIRFLTGGVDVQQGKFVVQIHGWGVQLEEWIVDRFDISASQRPEGDRHAAVDPAAYLEDWSLLDQLASRRYRFDGSDVELPVLITLVDSGGKAGVTSKAYSYWRSLRRKALHTRIQLVRGRGGRRNDNAERVKKTYPDTTNRRDRKAGATGDVPVWLINTNLLKDAVANDLAREEPGPGYIHIPQWLADDHPGFLGELVAEVRTEKGWENPGRKRNEGTDLANYNRAAMLAIKGDTINWDAPPAWAADPGDRKTSKPGVRIRGTAAPRVISKGIEL